MTTTGELFDGPFWIQVAILALFTLITPFPFWIGLPLAFGLTLSTRWLSAKFARVAIDTIHASGNIGRQQEYSRQESLIARGLFDQAVESFDLHLLEFPDDIPARLRLATLHMRERKDPAAAETELLAIRSRPHSRGVAMLLTNHFVDIYRATGQREKLTAELQRMMLEWPGTPMAAGAAKLLTEVTLQGRADNA